MTSKKKCRHGRVPDSHRTQTPTVAAAPAKIAKIKKHKTEVQDKYMLQDWQDRVNASEKLLAKHLKKIEAERLKEQELLREKRVSDALEAAKVLKADKEDLNLVDLRRTLKNVKMMNIYVFLYVFLCFSFCFSLLFRTLIS